MLHIVILKNMLAFLSASLNLSLKKEVGWQEWLEGLVLSVVE